jgi:hypothetical protein
MAMLLNPHSIEAQRLMSRVLTAHGRGPEAEQYAAAADRLAAANEANNGRSTTSNRSEPRPS